MSDCAHCSADADRYCDICNTAHCDACCCSCNEDHEETPVSENIVSYRGPLGLMTVPASVARRRLAYLRGCNDPRFSEEILRIEGALLDDRNFQMAVLTPDGRLRPAPADLTSHRGSFLRAKAKAWGLLPYAVPGDRLRVTCGTEVLWSWEVRG